MFRTETRTTVKQTYKQIKNNGDRKVHSVFIPFTWFVYKLTFYKLFYKLLLNYY